MFQQPLSNERGEGQRRFEDRAVTPCGQQRRSRQGSGQDCPRAPFLTALPTTARFIARIAVGRVAGFFANDRFTGRAPSLPSTTVSSSLSNPHSLLFGPNHATHYELRTDWIIWSSCMHQPNSERRRRSKKGQAKPMDHEYLPSSLLCLLCAYLTLCSAAAYYDDGEKGLWKQSNRRGCLVAK